jgi:undecaprenyl-diphosphatase
MRLNAHSVSPGHFDTLSVERKARLPENMLNFIAVRDHHIMRRVHQWRAPRWIRLWMLCATRGGDGWLWYAMGALVLLYGGPERFAAICAAALASGVGIALFLWMKRVTGRRRPCAIEPHCWANLLPPDHFSFPSGHSITAFATALSLGSFYPSLLIGLLFCAVSVAVSRIILGMHFLSDVMAGSGIGAMLGYCAFCLLH